jgi:hypothetical protein
MISKLDGQISYIIPWRRLEPKRELPQAENTRAQGEKGGRSTRQYAVTSGLIPGPWIRCKCLRLQCVTFIQGNVFWLG